MFTDMAKDVGGFGLSVVGAVGNALDLPGSMVRDALAGENFVDQLLTPFSDVNRTSGRKLLEKMGARRNKETGIGGWFRDPYEGVLDIAGFATEIVLDPWGPVGAAMKIPSLSRSVGATGRAANTTIRKLIPRLGDSAMNFVENTASTAARVSRTYFESAVQGMKTATRQGSVAKNLTPSLTKYENDIKTLGIGTLDQMKKRGYDFEDEALWSRLVRYAEGREDHYTSPDNIFRGDIVELPEALANVRLPITDVTTLSNGDTVYKVGNIPHVRFKKDDLVKVGTNPDFIPLEDDLLGLGDMWKRELEKSRVDSYNAGQKAPLIGDEAGIEHWPRQMKDLMKYIIRQEDGMFRSSSATRQFEKHPELFRDYVLTGNRGGTEATEALLKDSEWNTIVDEVRSVVDQEMLSKDGNAFAIGKATVRHIKRYAEKLGVDPEDLWEDIGLSRTKPWVEVPELVRRLEAYRGQMDQTARATFSPDAKVVNRAGIFLIVSALCIAQTFIDIFVDCCAGCAPPSLGAGFIDIGTQIHMEVVNNFIFQRFG